MSTSIETSATLLDYFDQHADQLSEACSDALRRAGTPDDAQAARLAHALRQALVAGDHAPLLGAARSLGRLAPLLRASAFAALRPAGEAECGLSWGLLEQLSELLDRAAQARPSDDWRGTLIGQNSELQTFKMLVENALDGIALSDDTGEVIYGNAAFAKMSGFGDRLIGSSIHDFFDAETDAWMEREVRPLLAKRGHWQGQVRYYRPDGTSWIAQASMFVITNRVGAPLNRAIIVRDVTELHEQQQHLRFFRALAENAPYSIGISDFSFQEVYANPAYHTLLGYPEGSMVGMDARNLIAGAADEPVWEILQQRGWWHGIMPLRRADGSALQADGAMFLIPDEQGQPCALGGVLRDVTQELADQTQLQLTKERLEQMFETMPLAAIELDTNGTTISWNGSAERLFGWRADEVLGQHAATFIIRDLPADQAHQVMMEALRRSSDRIQMHTNYTKDGRALTCRWYSNAICNARGEVVGYLGLAEDVTLQVQRDQERERLQEQVIAVQREALRELSTPLIPVADDVVVMPLIGSIDSTRARQVVEALLDGVASTRARMAILDITGVSIVDTQVADALLRAAQAVKLLGAQTVLTGIRPEVAQTLTGLGVDLGKIITRSTLQSGIALALRARGSARG